MTVLTHRTVINALQASLLLLLFTSTSTATQTACIDRLARASNKQLGTRRRLPPANTNPFGAYNDTPSTNPFDFASPSPSGDKTSTSTFDDTNPFAPGYKTSPSPSGDKTDTNTFDDTNPFAPGYKTSPSPSEEKSSTSPSDDTNPVAPTGYTLRPCTCAKALKKLRSENQLTDVEYAQAFQLLTEDEKKDCYDCDDNGIALCGLCFGDVKCYSLDEARNCGHWYCAECIRTVITDAIHTQDFPVYCPGGVRIENQQSIQGCAMVCNEVIQRLADDGVIEHEGIYGATRFLRLQDKAINPESEQKMSDERNEHQEVATKMSTKVDQATADFLSNLTKPCPGCGLPTAKYRGHGCHHILCKNPKCERNWCYVCSKEYTVGKDAYYKPTCSCDLHCNNSCGCPSCPDCKPECPKCSGTGRQDKSGHKRGRSDPYKGDDQCRACHGSGRDACDICDENGQCSACNPDLLDGNNTNNPSGSVTYAIW